MRRFRMEKIGAGLGIATGVAALSLAAFAGMPLAIFGIREFGGTHAIKPLIGPGWSGVLYAITILASGLLALRRPLWGGVALFLSALVGLLFSTSRSLFVEAFSVIAAVLCLLGWSKARSGPSMKT